MMTPTYEVEMKFSLADVREFTERLRREGMEFSTPQEETDLYFQHPCRDFRQTDEALRLRRVGGGSGGGLCITYKGKRLDTTTKTRQELELELDVSQSESWKTMLENLGFRPVDTVHKWRRTASFCWENRHFTVTLDTVPVLKPNDSFVEIETIAETDELDVARDTLLRLATHWGLNPSASIKQSYLSMVLSR